MERRTHIYIRITASRSCAGLLVCSSARLLVCLSARLAVCSCACLPLAHSSADMTLAGRWPTGLPPSSSNATMTRLAVYDCAARSIPCVPDEVQHDSPMAAVSMAAEGTATCLCLTKDWSGPCIWRPAADMVTGYLTALIIAVGEA
jgi:hypothetical protein